MSNYSVNICRYCSVSEVFQHFCAQLNISTDFSHRLESRRIHRMIESADFPIGLTFFELYSRFDLSVVWKMDFVLTCNEYSFCFMNRLDFSVCIK
jgi:hypothetical protein